MDTSPRSRGTGWSFFQWFSGIVGGLAAFLGLFILFGPVDEYVGLGGDLSWRVGDIADAWMYGLLIAGAALLLICLSMLVAGRRRVSMPSTTRSDLLVHFGVFLVVNAFIWIQDFAIGGGLDYAYWTTIPWGAALAIHAAYVAGAASARQMPVVEPEVEKELQHH